MKYKNHDEAVIIACFYNPTRSEYRRKAFDIFYESIKHLNYRIVECVGLDDQPELALPNVSHMRTDSKAWHKETLLNQLIAALPPQFRYVFWVDADVIFANPNWLVDAVQALQTNKLVQPFEYGIHLNRDEMTPSFNVDAERQRVNHKMVTEKPYTKMWRSFASNWQLDRATAKSANYDHHGHVGFAWGARREVLEQVRLFDKALIGGADHIMAHAAVGQIFSLCIKKSFGRWFAFWWSISWYLRIRGKLGYAPGDLYHIWHGEIKKREYLKRIQDFTPMQKNLRRREDGFYEPTPQAQSYYQQYMENRERVDEDNDYESNIADTGYDYNNDNSPATGAPVSDSSPSWGGFGGGGDFAGGGAGGSWDSSSAGIGAEVSASVGSSYENYS